MGRFAFDFIFVLAALALVVCPITLKNGRDAIGKACTAMSCILFSVLLSGCDAGPLASPDSIKAKVVQSLQQKNFTAAAEQAEDLIKKMPDGPEGYFLMAQARAQLGDRNAALAALETAIKKGFKDDKAIDGNENIRPIRTMPAYVELMDGAFPGRVRKVEVEAGAGVGISQSDSKTVIRAGDVVVEMPKDK